MKKNIFISLALAIFLFSCIDVTEKNQKDILSKNIELHENRYFATEQYQANKVDLDSMITLYSEFIDRYSDDSLTVFYKYKKANMYTAIQDYSSAVKTYDEICNNYPNFINRPKALFFQAMIYGDNLKNEILAEQKYREFIADYPNNEFRDDAEKSIEFLGKTDAEIIEMLTKKDTLQ